MKRILFLVPYPLHESPSQRFRFEQYFAILKNQGYDYEVQSFLDSKHWKIFFTSGRALAKIRALMMGYAKRFIALFKSPMYDFVFIHREAAPLGPPIFEWMLAKIFRRKLIFDFDDAIWLTDRKNESLLLKLGKWRRKVRAICKWSYKVSCGNAYLCEYAQLYNQRVIRNPTTIDTDHMHNPALFEKPAKSDRIIIGWTGSHSTLKYLDEIEEVLQKISEQYPLTEFWVIADRKPTLLKINNLTFIPWNFETEIRTLNQMDIGIMPLPDDMWSNGKCGFKALQYMAMEVPAVAAPVGVNSTIIDEGVNGFLCDTTQAWEEALRKLIQNPVLRKSMGSSGRKKVIENYSVRSNASTFLSLFD